MTDAELALRRTIMEAFARTGAPPRAVEDRETLDRLAERHVVVLDEDGTILMAHPFAAHTDGARVDAGGRTWWGNCAWDGLGIVAALRLPTATVTAQGVTLHVHDGQPREPGWFHVEVPARRWWDDVGYT